MIEYAKLHPGPGFSPGRAALYYAQRLVSPYWLRRTVASTIAGSIAVRHPRARHDFHQRDMQNRLKEKGLTTLPDLVPRAWIDAIMVHLTGKDVIAKGKVLPLGVAALDNAMADYPLYTVLSCALIVAIINMPEIVSLAGEYLGCSPTLSSVGLRWSFPSLEPDCDVQRFHRDPDDWRILKLFVYLTDVDEHSGPHVYVEGSHRSSVHLRARPYDMSDILKRYGANAATAVTGPAGTAFVADTQGIHMGKPPTDRPRLMLTAQYSLLPIFAFRYSPLPLVPRPAVDPYVNRLIIA